MDLKVIVTINETNADKYNALFAKAYKALVKSGVKVEDMPATARGEGRFTTLNQYMSFAEQLLALDPTYLLLPLDEPAFEINADARTIKAPKIAVLQNDTNAETVQFTIDRYFDQQDLSEAQIFVQWTRPDGLEGATVVEMVDTTLPGKLRFGWTLTTDVTAVPGVVKYSVRFWNVHADEVVYSLNTLTSSLTISPSLHPIVKDSGNVIRPSGLFASAVRNSMLSDEGSPLPLAPYFFSPGEDLPRFASLKDILDSDDIKIGDTLTLKAQAGVGDTGVLAYNWYYKPAANIKKGSYTYRNDVFYPFNDLVEVTTDAKGNTKSTVILQGFDKLDGTVEEIYELYEYNKAGKLEIGERYYNEDHSAYESILPPTDGRKLYTKYTTYTVPSSGAVTGEYKVCATNTLGGNTTPEHSSSICQLVSPDNVVITKNLDSALTNGSGKTLSITAKDQTYKDQVAVSYAWYKSVKSDANADFVLDASKTGNSYALSTPGWYKAVITANLNREPKSETSAVCKVTFAPKKPNLNYVAADVANLAKENNVPIFTGNTATLRVANIELRNATEIAEGYSVDLFSDDITYQWTKQKADGKEIKLSQADIDSNLIEGPIDRNVLVVKTSGDSAFLTFRCYATNHLGKDTATSDPLAFRVD